MRKLPVVAALLLLAAGCGSGTPTAADRIVETSVQGTAFMIRLASGRELRGAQLQGATLTLAMADGIERRVKIDDVRADPDDIDHEITLYHMLALDAASATSEVCEPDPKGERWAFPVRGRWNEDGKHISDDGYTLTCSSGAQGKCVRFGYKPWKTLTDGTALAPYHQACVRAVTADYCGSRPTTRNGMLIDIYDLHGVQTSDAAADAQGVRFEAAFTPEGASCVAHTRVPENITLDQLASACPRLAGRLGPQGCSEEGVRHSDAKALIFIRSR